MRKIYLLLIPFLFLLSSNKLFAQNELSANDVLRKFLDATGGVKKWKKVKSLEVSGISSNDRNESRTYETIYRKKPFTFYSKVERVLESIKTEKGFWSRKEGGNWMHWNRQDYALDCPNNINISGISKALFFAMYIDHADLASIIQDEETDDYFVIKINSDYLSEELDNIRCYFSKKTFLLEKIKSIVEVGSSVTEFKDYQKSGGFMFPTRSIHYTNYELLGGNKVSNNVRLKVRFNFKVDPEIFDPQP